MTPCDHGNSDVLVDERNYRLVYDGCFCEASGRTVSWWKRALGSSVRRLVEVREEG